MTAASVERDGLEIDRMLMQREDTLSMQFEILFHHQRFKQKDQPAPAIPIYILPRQGAPLEYKPLPPTPKVSEPICDNYTKFQINLKLP